MLKVGSERPFFKWPKWDFACEASDFVVQSREQSRKPNHPFVLTESNVSFVLPGSALGYKTLTRRVSLVRWNVVFVVCLVKCQAPRQSTQALYAAHLVKNSSYREINVEITSGAFQ